MTRWQAWIISLVLIGAGVESGAFALEGRWLLAGGVILMALALGMALSMLLTLRRELGATRKALNRALRRNQRQLSAILFEQGEAFAKIEKQVLRIDKNVAVRRELLEGKLWGAAIPLPKLSKLERRGYLAAVVIVKDEGPYLREWLEFHRLVGVQHVFLYDNGSSDSTQEILSDFLRTDYVTRIPWSSFVMDGSPQRLAYAHALLNFGPGWRWMALIDADEFLFPTTEADSLPSVLAGYEHLPALAVYWRTFGFSGHEKRPPGLVIENFTMRAPFPPEPGVKRSLLKFKSIVDPSRVNAVVTPHVVKLENGVIGAYTEDGILDSADGDRKGYASNGHLRINHYYTKSKEELEHKLSRGSGAGMPMDDRKEIVSKRIALVEIDLIEDKTIQRFLPELHRIMADYSGGTG